MTKIGFIGLGNMGVGMAINLSKNNLEILGFDINRDRFKYLKNENIKQMDNLKALIELSDIIITMLPDGKIVKNVWSEIMKYSRNKQYIIDCSTIDVKTSIQIQQEAQKKDLFTLDASVSGGVMGANQGTLTFMIGGSDETYNEMKFIFEIMGKNSILCGKIGAGQSAKICNNMLLATTMIAVGESFELGQRLDLDPNKLFDVLSTSSGSCWAINTYCPIQNVGPTSPSDNGYKGGFSSSLMFKDLGLALEAVKQTNSKASYGIQTYKKFKSIVDNGKGDLDFSNVINE